MTYTKNEFDNLTREDRELHKFCQTPAWKIAIRMKWIAWRQYRDASDRELPEITPWEENSWVISVWWILPYLGIVNPGDYIIFDWTNRTKLDPTINTDETLEGNGTSSKPLTVVQNYLKLDQTTPQEITGSVIADHFISKQSKTYAYNIDWTINTITFSWWRVITYSYTDWEIISWSDTMRTWTVTRTDWVITAITVAVL